MNASSTPICFKIKFYEDWVWKLYQKIKFFCRLPHIKIAWISLLGLLILPQTVLVLFFTFTSDGIIFVLTIGNKKVEQQRYHLNIGQCKPYLTITIFLMLVIAHNYTRRKINKFYYVSLEILWMKIHQILIILIRQ